MDPNQELLQQLADIDLPVETGLGIAPGWYLLGLLVGLGIYLIFRIWTRYQQRKAMDWRPDANTELVLIKQHLTEGASEQVLSGSSRLARRVALAVSSRSEIAALSGSAWLVKLDEITGTKSFTEGAGQVLATGPYKAQPDLDNKQLEELVSLMEHLVKSASTLHNNVNASGSVAHG